MWGAYNMAEVLHETASSQGAFQRYEQQMRPHVEAQQKSACGFAKTFLPGSRLGLFFQQVMLKVFLREAFHCLLRRQLGAPSILPASQHGEASDTITNVISSRLSTLDFC
jgi:2-polyprenyl-6-methoxyphenol hydroxylase-like FAD-dependent oxidoreductase